VTTGWTPEARKSYFRWFKRGARQRPYLNQVRTAALATLTDAEEADPELTPLLAPYKQPAPGGGGRGVAAPETKPSARPRCRAAACNEQGCRDLPLVRADILDKRVEPVSNGKCFRLRQNLPGFET
jgi:hypothetical protein